MEGASTLYSLQALYEHRIGRAVIVRGASDATKSARSGAWWRRDCNAGYNLTTGRECNGACEDNPDREFTARAGARGHDTAEN